MSPYYKNALICSRNLSSLSVHDVLHQYTSQTIMTYTQKPASVFTQAEVLADAADDQCSVSRSVECVSYYIQLPKSFYPDSAISVFSYTTQFILCDVVALFDRYCT